MAFIWLISSSLRRRRPHWTYIGAWVHEGKFFSAYHPASGDDNGPFDHVSKLPDIARPMVRIQKIQRLLGKTSQGFSCFLDVAFEKVTGEYRNIIQSLAQRRDVNADHVDAIIKVVPELIFLYQRGQVTVGGADEPKIRLNGLAPPNRRKLFSSSTRSRLTCILAEISPTSSRKSVPL